MPADFPTFKQDILDYMQNTDIEKSIEDSAKIIVDSYVNNVVSNGADPLSMNTLEVLPPKQSALEQGFVQMMTLAFETNVPATLAVVVPSLVAFWAGELLSTSGMVPGTISTVTSVVTVPGVPVPIPFPPPGDSETQLVDVLEIFFKTHLTTVSGITTGLVPAPPAPPIPTPFPWVGYL